MSTDKFFEESKEQSIVKATIVSKYFYAWAKVLISQVKNKGKKIAYIDLFAGPGRYKDGSKSTPILILEKAIADDDMREMLVTIFNDGDPEHAESLKKTIAEIPGINTLKYAPDIKTIVVGEELAKIFEKMKLVPTLFFVDPWGYKGLSLRLINSVLKNFGCDCIIFFNFNRINMGLSNPLVKEHMSALFGSERVESLKQRLDKMKPDDRELTVVEEISDALKEMGGKFVLPFRFRNSAGNRTSHYLIFVSKHFRGYEIMKEIMAKESSANVQGVPTLEYIPADKNYPTLFNFSLPLEELEEMLLEEFSGQTLTMQQIYEQHNVGKRYIKKNYKDVLQNMEMKGEILADPPANKRKIRNGKPTFADSVKATFRKWSK
jgi:three-Cys-motif partner protein